MSDNLYFFFVRRLLATACALLVFSAAVYAGAEDTGDMKDVPATPGTEASPATIPQLAPVVVSATRSETPLSQVPANMTILTAEDIAQSGALAVDDLLRQIPGFNTFRRSSSLVTAPAQDPEAQGVTLRGIGPGGASRALVLLDGVPVNDAFGGWLYWGELPLANIERIEVMRGGSSSLWGNFALGGVINLITKTPEEQSIFAKVSGGNRGTTDNAISYTDVRGPFKLSVHGKFFHTDGWNIIAPAQRGPIDGNSSSEHKVFNGRLDYSPCPRCAVFLRGAYYEETRNTGTRLRIGDAQRGFISGGGSLQTDDGSDWQLSLFSHLSWFREHFSRVSEDRTRESPRQHQTVPSTDVGGSLTWSRRSFASHLLSAGVDFRLIEGESRDVFFNAASEFLNRRVSKGKQQFVGFFLQDVYTPLPQLQLALGVRLDDFHNFSGSMTDTTISSSSVDKVRFPHQSKTVFSPRLSFRYQLWPSWAVHGAGYQSFRAPTLSELYRRSSIEGLVLRENPRLRPEFLEGGELGFDYTGLIGLDARVTAYWNNLRRPIANATTAHDPDTGEDAERTRLNLGSARVRGVELDVTYQVTPQWTVFGGYLYSDAVVCESPVDRALEGKRLTQIPRFGGTVGFRYRRADSFTLLVQSRYEGKKFEDADNHDTLGGYYVVDMTLSYPLRALRILPGLRDGDFFFAVQNLLDRDYEVDKGGGILKLGTPLLVHGGVQLQW